MFFSLKEGRTDPRIGAQDCRILCACVYLNAHSKPPGWMREFSSTVNGLWGEFSAEDVEFANVDDWDSFETVKCAERAQRYLVFVFRCRSQVYKFRAKCIVQGCNTPALFHPVHKISTFDRIVGRAWKRF